VAIVATLLLGGGVAITRARFAPGPPLLTWDGPDGPAGARETEARLIEAARQSPADARAPLELGELYLENRKPFEALWALRDAQRLDPKALKPRLLIARALTAGHLYQSALTLLQGVLRERPDDPEAAGQLAVLQLSLGRSTDAIAALGPFALGPSGSAPTAAGPPTSRVPGPLTTAVWLLRGRALEAAGRDAEALALYRRCQRSELKTGEAAFRIVRLLLRLGRSADARQALVAMRGAESRSAEARYDRGLAELMQGPSHEEEARQQFVAALDSDDRFVPAHEQMGLYFLRHHDGDRALSAFSRAFQLDPHNAAAVLQLSHVRRAMGDRIGAISFQAVYDDLMDARPKAAAQYQALAAVEENPRGPLLVSNAYLKMDRQLEAARVLRAGLRRYPGDAALTERLIAGDLLTGDASEAESLCREWMRREPTASRPVWLLGRVLLSHSDPQGALQLFQRVGRAEPRNAEYQFSLGSAYADQPSPANWELAARYFGQAAAFQPEEARYRLNLAIALRNIGNLPGARRQFLRAMDLDMNQSAPLNNVVQVARGLKQYDQVEFWGPLVRDVEERLREELPDWKRVWDSPQDVSGYLPLAHFLERAGELRQARNILEQAVALRPNLAPARRELQTLQRALDVL
jgi:tetratricopeptide (TPR) repeat protein